MKKVMILLMFAGIACIVFLLATGRKEGQISRGDSIGECVLDMVSRKMTDMEESGPEILVEGKSLRNFGYTLHVEEGPSLYVSESFMEDLMGCSVNIYSSGRAVVDRAKASIEFDKADLKSIDNKIYFPVNDCLEQLGYTVRYSLRDNTVNFINQDGGDYLPDAYDMREHDRVTPVRDQGPHGTCWAFASLGALETTTMPTEENIYSVDHMSLNNGFNLDLSAGGEHTMSIAYLAAWHGPVLESQDPYNDGVTDGKLKAVKHLEEAIIMDERDDTKIKSAIYKYGGVETSVYLEMPYGSTQSEYYNNSTRSYYYYGSERPNHDLIVVGWNDHYPRENFEKKPEHDGAFICKNSWGEDFGEDGYFYVSYDDVNICNKSIVYTRVGASDNYDHIYQSDLLGWIGQMGFSGETAYMANVYTAERDELLKAVSFYATGDSTRFRVFIVRDFKDVNSLNRGRLEIGKGETRYAGYYTVDLKKDISLKKGQRFAVVMSVTTPGSEKPIAIECDAGERTTSLDLSDGEGYMSQYGEVWHSAEEKKANICLKVFTVDP